VAVNFWLLAIVLVPSSCWLIIGDVGYLLSFSPLLVPSSEDKKEFRQEVAYNELALDSMILILPIATTSY
jgi:hypothetical protein